MRVAHTRSVPLTVQTGPNSRLLGLHPIFLRHAWRRLGGRPVAAVGRPQVVEVREVAEVGGLGVARRQRCRPAHGGLGVEDAAHVAEPGGAVGVGGDLAEDEFACVEINQ